MEVGRGGVLLGNRSEMPEDLACPRHGSSVEKDVTTTSPLYSPPPPYFSIACQNALAPLLNVPPISRDCMPVATKKQKGAASPLLQ
jgi:hypothetical protein